MLSAQKDANGRYFVAKPILMASDDIAQPEPPLIDQKQESKNEDLGIRDLGIRDTVTSGNSSLSVLCTSRDARLRYVKRKARDEDIYNNNNTGANSVEEQDSKGHKRKKTTGDDLPQDNDSNASINNEGDLDADSICVPLSFIKTKVKDEYRRGSNYHCLNDSFPFTGVPFGLPLSYHAKTKIFGVYGRFCSAACVKRYAMDTRALPLPLNKLLSLIATMFVLTFGIKDIIAAPPVACLAIHLPPGEGLSIEQYRAMGTAGTFMELYFQPFMFAPVSVGIQRVLSAAEIEDKLSTMDVRDKLKRKRLRTSQARNNKTTAEQQVNLASLYKSEIFDTGSQGGAHKKQKI